MYDLLAQHPGILMSTVKEPRLFQREDYLQKMDWYQSLFSTRTTEEIQGEASPVYSETTFYPHIPRRIHEYNPESKFVYIVRSPLLRLASVWTQAQSTGHWADKESYGTKMPLVYSEAVFSYPPFIEACRYWTHIRNYLEYFQRENFKVILFESFVVNPDSIMEEIFLFLGVDPQFRPEYLLSPKNAREEKEMFNPWPDRVGHLVPEVLRKRAPRSIGRYSNKLLSKLPTKTLRDPELSIQDRARVMSELEGEVTALYDFLELDEDPWGFFEKAIQQ